MSTSATLFYRDDVGWFRIQPLRSPESGRGTSGLLPPLGCAPGPPGPTPTAACCRWGLLAPASNENVAEGSSPAAAVAAASAATEGGRPVLLWTSAADPPGARLGGCGCGAALGSTAVDMAADVGDLAGPAPKPASGPEDGAPRPAPASEDPPFAAPTQKADARGSWLAPAPASSPAPTPPAAEGGCCPTPGSGSAVVVELGQAGGPKGLHIMGEAEGGTEDRGGCGCCRWAGGSGVALAGKEGAGGAWGAGTGCGDCGGRTGLLAWVCRRRRALPGVRHPEGPAS